MLKKRKSLCISRGCNIIEAYQPRNPLYRSIHVYWIGRCRLLHEYERTDGILHRGFDGPVGEGKPNRPSSPLTTHGICPCDPLPTRQPYQLLKVPVPSLSKIKTNKLLTQKEKKYKNRKAKTKQNIPTDAPPTQWNYPTWLDNMPATWQVLKSHARFLVHEHAWPLTHTTYLSCIKTRN